MLFRKKTAKNQREIRKIVLFVRCLAHTPTQNIHKDLAGFLIIISGKVFLNKPLLYGQKVYGEKPFPCMGETHVGN
jgi:hypothetical protein